MTLIRSCLRLRILAQKLPVPIISNNKCIISITTKTMMVLCFLFSHQSHSKLFQGAFLSKNLNHHHHHHLHHGMKSIYTSSIRNNNYLKSISKTVLHAAGDNKIHKDALTAQLSPEVIVPKKFVPFPFPYHSILNLRVESLTNLGVGVCRVDLDMTPLSQQNQKQETRESNKNHHQNQISDENDNHDNDDDNNDDAFQNDDDHSDSKGWVVMVPNTIPGEYIQARIYRNHKTYSDADLIEILQPSQSRVTPVCPLFNECGGCQYQHMDISMQRQWKTEQVQQLLQRIGKFDPQSFPATLPTVGTQETYNYRSKITPHYDAPTKDSKTGLLEIQAIGFKKQTSRQTVDVPNCSIATKNINEKLTSVRNEAFLQAREGKMKRPKKGATLLLRDAQVYDESVHDAEVAVVETDPNVYVKTKVKDLTFRFLAGNFFQNNPYMLPVMVDHVINASLQPNQKTGEKMTHLIDCYCGSGLFCLSASAHFDLCVGIEVNEKAVEEARINANINHITNCQFVAASAEAIFESQQPVPLIGSENSTTVGNFPRDTTVVVLDPPRKGCSEEFLDQLFQYEPQRIVYMSCDPATQARDARKIVDAGYRLLSTQPFDLFPQTRHIECLIVFEK